MYLNYHPDTYCRNIGRSYKGYYAALIRQSSGLGIQLANFYYGGEALVDEHELCKLEAVDSSSTTSTQPTGNQPVGFLFGRLAGFLYIYYMALTIILLVALGVMTYLYFKKKCPSVGEQEAHIENTFFFDNVKIKGKNMALTAAPNQRIPFVLQPVDRRGNAAPVEAGTVEYWVDDETIADVEEDPTNELAGWLITKAVGVTQINYKADADLGEGVTEISGFDAIEVKPEQAVGFGITFGPAEDIEETP